MRQSVMHAQVNHLESRLDNYQRMMDFLRLSRKTVCIYSQQLDGHLFNTNEFSLCIRKLLSEHRHIQIRILLFDVDPVIKQGHRLIELARRATSNISIRIVARQFRSNISAFMVFDNSMLIYRKNTERFEGVAEADNKKRVLELTDYFNNVWEVSQEDPNFRRLHI
jgi:hypothetical protein